jgi:hypothetical protein
VGTLTSIQHLLQANFSDFTDITAPLQTAFQQILTGFSKIHISSQLSSPPSVRLSQMTSNCQWMSIMHIDWRSEQLQTHFLEQLTAFISQYSLQQRYEPIVLEELDIALISGLISAVQGRDMLYPVLKSCVDRYNEQASKKEEIAANKASLYKTQVTERDGDIEEDEKFRLQFPDFTPKMAASDSDQDYDGMTSGNIPSTSTDQSITAMDDDWVLTIVSSHLHSVAMTKSETARISRDLRQLEVRQLQNEMSFWQQHNESVGVMATEAKLVMDNVGQELMSAMIQKMHPLQTDGSLMKKIDAAAHIDRDLLFLLDPSSNGESFTDYRPRNLQIDPYPEETVSSH